MRIVIWTITLMQVSVSADRIGRSESMRDIRSPTERRSTASTGNRNMCCTIIVVLSAASRMPVYSATRRRNVSTMMIVTMTSATPATTRYNHRLS